MGQIDVTDAWGSLWKWKSEYKTTEREIDTIKKVLSILLALAITLVGETVRKLGWVFNEIKIDSLTWVFNINKKCTLKTE